MNADILQGILGIIVLLVAAAGRTIVQARIGPERIGAVFQLARVVVTGVERFGQDYGHKGADKLALATSAVLDGARRFGIKLSDDEATSIIHAALADIDFGGGGGGGDDGSPLDWDDQAIQDWLIQDQQEILRDAMAEDASPEEGSQTELELVG